MAAVADRARGYEDCHGVLESLTPDEIGDRDVMCRQQTRIQVEVTVTPAEFSRKMHQYPTSVTYTLNHLKDPREFPASSCTKAYGLSEYVPQL